MHGSVSGWPHGIMCRSALLYRSLRPDRSVKHYQARSPPLRILRRSTPKKSQDTQHIHTERRSSGTCQRHFATIQHTKQATSRQCSEQALVCTWTRPHPSYAVLMVTCGCVPNGVPSKTHKHRLLSPNHAVILRSGGSTQHYPRKLSTTEQVESPRTTCLGS